MKANKKARKIDLGNSPLTKDLINKWSFANEKKRIISLFKREDELVEEINLEVKCPF